MDGETFDQEVRLGSPAESASSSADSFPPSPVGDAEGDASAAETLSLPAEEEKREPVKIHIKLSDLVYSDRKAFTRKRKPRWYCYQCRITFFAARHLDRHLLLHVSESQLGVKVIKLPLPAEVVETAARRYREAEIVERALLQAARDIEADRRPTPYVEPFRLRLDAEPSIAEDGIPEVQTEINATDEDSFLTATSGAQSDPQVAEVDDRETLLGPDLSKTLFEITKSVLDLENSPTKGQKNALFQPKNAFLGLKNAILQQKNAKFEQKNANFEQKNANFEKKNSIFDPKNANFNLKNANFELKNANLEQKNAILEQKNANFNLKKLEAKNSVPERVPVPKLISDSIPIADKTSSGCVISIIDPLKSKIDLRNLTHYVPEVKSASVPLPLPVPKLIPDERTISSSSSGPYVVARNTLSGASISIVDPLAIETNKRSISNAKTAFSSPKSLKSLLESELPVDPIERVTSVMEPERCASVMIIENESRIVNGNGRVVRSAPTLMNHLLAPPPYRPLTPNNVARRAPAPPMPRQPPPSVIRQAPAVLRQHWKHTVRHPGPTGHNVYGGPLPPSSGLRIQEVVSLAKKHVMEDPESSCSCIMCMEIRCGDLWRKSQQTGPNGAVSYQCVICCERFAGKSQLLRHCRRTRHSYICELCGSGFLVQSLYQMHGKVHAAKQQAAQAIKAASLSGGAIVSRAAEDEVVVVGERIMVKRPNPPPQAPPKQNGPNLSRILHNSEITLTPIATGSGSSSGSGSGVGKGNNHMMKQTGSEQSNAHLRKILPSPAPPSYPLPPLATPISSPSLSTLSELRKVVTSLAQAQQQQQAQMAPGGARPLLPGSVYRMMPLSNGKGPPAPRPAPTWHHPVAPPPSAPRPPLPMHPALSSALRQQLTALTAPYKRILPSPNVTVGPNGPFNGLGPPRPPPAVAPVRCHVCNMVFRSIVAFQMHFDQVHKKQPAAPFKCQRCLKAYPAAAQLQRHEAACGDKVRCRKCNTLLNRNQVITHFALVHPEAGSAPKELRLAHMLMNKLRDGPAPEQEVIEILPVNRNHVIDITPSITVTPISGPQAEIAVTETEVDVRKPEEKEPAVVSARSISSPEKDAVSVDIFASELQPEVVDISAEITPLHETEPEVNSPNGNAEEMEPEVPEEKSAEQPEAVPEPEAFTESELEAEIHREMNFGPELFPPTDLEPELDVEREVEGLGNGDSSPQPEDIVLEPETQNLEPEAIVLEADETFLEQTARASEANTPETAEVPAAEPEVFTVEPEDLTIEPEELTMEPEELTMEPEELTMEPEELTMEPEVLTMEPEELTIEPEELTMEPEETMDTADENRSTPEIELDMCEMEERACVVCDRTFDDASSLQEHLQSHQPLEEPEAEAKVHTCEFCHQTFSLPRQLSFHLRSHFASCSGPRSPARRPHPSPPKRPHPSPPKRPQQSPTQPSPPKRPRMLQPAEASGSSTPDNDNLAVAILDMNRLGASADVFRRLGVVGFMSLKELKHFLCSDDPTGSPNYIKKF